MKVSLVLFLSVILIQVKVIYGESLEDDDQITTTVQPEAIPEDNVQENSVVSSNNNNKTKTSSTSLPSLIGNIVTHLGKQITMCDFNNFGLIFTGQMHCLPQRLKSTLFEIFSNRG